MKVIYLDKETGKEVHYGESITFKETHKLDYGYSYKSVTTVPIINSTIPYLIEKGVLVQKEVKDDSKVHKEYTIEEKLNLMSVALNTLFKKVQKIEKDLYEDN